MQTTAIPIACSFESPEFVSLDRSGAKGTAATSAIIIGGNLFSSNTKTLLLPKRLRTLRARPRGGISSPAFLPCSGRRVADE